MPRITKLIPIDGGLGVKLDIQPSPQDGDSVTIYTEQEITDLKRRIAKEAAAVCRELADTWARKDAEQDALERAALEIEKMYCEAL